jgi:hypothetical protein
MTGRVRVAGLDRGVQRLDRLEQRRFELAGRLDEVVLARRGSSFCARMRTDALRTRIARTSQRTPKTMPTAYQIVPRVSAMIAVTTESSSETSAAPTGRPPRS